MEHKIDFVEETHSYYVDGILKPSVSQIIKSVIKNDIPLPDYITKWAPRGKYLHKIVNMSLLETLDESSIDESVIGFYESFKKYKEKNKLKVEFTEKILYNEKDDYCMTIDYVGLVESKCEDDLPTREILDWKGGLYGTEGYQLGGYYCGLVDVLGLRIDKIACVQWMKNGTIAKRHDFDIEKCAADWKAINRVYRLKLENKK